ncbi:MAG TPA: SWIM zinc finger family protein [bacterium]|nr:SWIM zinc finger family protein [bacterium]
MKPPFDLDKIKFTTDQPTFDKAIDLYEKGKVTQFREDTVVYSAIVLGTRPYRVSIDTYRFGFGSCECYLGQQNTLCKHIVALSIYAVMGGQKLSEEDKKQIVSPTCSCKRGELSKEELVQTKKDITSAMKYIKPYRGPSRLWFAYQDSLGEGCARLAKLVSDLPVSEQTATLLIDLLLRLDKKLRTGGVDDSDGIVGDFIEGVVSMLQEYAEIDQNSIRAFKKLRNKETCFGWEEPLVKIADKDKG